LRDPRVKAILAINPIGSSLFGKSGYEDIAIPTMIVSGSNDTAAPALLEQVRPFTWLQTNDKYLVLLQGGTHFSTIDASLSNANAIPLPPSVVGPDPAIAFAYLERLGVAFFKTYVTGDSNYQPYLSAAYAREISRPLMPISIVRSLPLFELNTNRKSP
jgi:predicted dienelactone hydrolase